MVQKEKKCMKVELKWKCKVGTCIVTYYAKWLLTKHLKEVHGLMIKKAKLGRPSTSERSPQHQDHAKMDICILRDAMVVQTQNDQKVVSRVHAKAQRKWDELVIVVKQCPPLSKSTLVKLASTIVGVSS
jgi:hypothetical protein